MLQRFLGLFKRSPVVPTARQVRVVFRESTTYTVDEWRQTPDLVKLAQKVLEDQNCKMMIDALKNSHIGNYGVSGFPSLEVRAVLQAQGEAYSQAIHDFISLGVYQPPKQEIEPTFEPEEKQQPR